MSSQLNVDTIVDKAGSGGSNVKMANTSTYVDGSVSQNTVQGIAKAWAGGLTDGAADDSFSFSSFTDLGSGDNTCTFTNTMSNTGYSSLATVDIAGTVANRLAVVYAKSTSLFKIESFIADTAGNSGSDQNCTVHGDLA